MFLILPMNNFTIIKDYLPKDTLEHIKYEIKCAKFPWFYSCVTYPHEPGFMFTHRFYDIEGGIKSNRFSDLILPILGNIKYKVLRRIKANCYTRGQDHVKHDYHIDDKVKHKVALFTINTNNGYTEFENGERIPSVENTLALFDGSVKHRSVTQTDENLRINININYDEEIWNN